MSRLTFCFPPGTWPLLLCIFILTSFYNIPAYAAGSWCRSGGSNDIMLSLNDVKVTHTPGQGQEVYNSGKITTNYQCYQAPGDSSSALRARLRISIANAAALDAQLRAVGLKLQIAYSDGGFPLGSYYDLNEVADFASANTMGSGITLNSSFNFALRITTLSGFSGAVKVHIPEIRPLVSVSPGLGDLTIGTGLNISTSGFNLNVIPRCFGRVNITPSVISFGHIYTFQSSVNKQASFTVTASRDTGCLTPGDNDSYDWFDLYSTFTSGNALTDGNKSLLLADSKGTLNGLKLSLQDESAAPVLFSTSSTFGKLWKDTGSNNASLTKRYTARLNLTGQPLVTGPFSADVVVTITYE
ncbi:hypothetical protein D5P88_22095 [Salmonella enterica subsp. enterica]|nr:hypothetical protein [Salmonella enterica subsp. enterica]